jgi:hypothetical protein
MRLREGLLWAKAEAADNAVKLADRITLIRRVKISLEANSG